ncbi:FG-GAP repeat domain-containing protein [Streptomyces sp. NPDC007355]|uniref:FG-GAP repeat domain-containing protein n=1 Tax=Streptomyces sp. NPDC007355 TaxID=3364778 RepID=UPI0036CAD403
MSSTVMPRRRLVAAVTVTLAATLGVTTLSAPAFAAPVVVAVASTGESAQLAVIEHNVPAVANLDRPGPFVLTWKIGPGPVTGWITVTHVKTGIQSSTSVDTSTNDPWFAPSLDLQRKVGSGALPNGDYTWNVDVNPATGTGAGLSASGTFKIARATKPHDFNDNGAADLLSRDSSGTLWRHDSDVSTVKVGTGWQVYDRIEAAGNLGGSAVGDVLGRDGGGTLWLHKGVGDGTFAPGRIKVGIGWNAYNHLAAGSDVTGDGLPDLVGIDKSGVLRVHTGTGSTLAPFAPGRKSAGAGWGVYNEIAAVGNLAGAAAGDLVARDRNGVLWLHLGKGDGTFAPRTRIGAGWNAYSQIVGVGDDNRDGRPDLIGVGANRPFFYKGLGDWKYPLSVAEERSSYAGNPPYNTFA